MSLSEYNQFYQVYHRGDIKITNFFNLFRKKGVELTLGLLSKAEDKQMLQSEFLNSLKDKKNDLNAYFRIKKELLYHKIIGFKLNRNAKKVIYLTDRGKRIYEYLMYIEKELNID